jgi:hypothetical protein
MHVPSAYQSGCGPAVLEDVLPERDESGQGQDHGSAETELASEPPPVDPGPIDIDFVMKEFLRLESDPAADLDVDPGIGPSSAG